MPDQSKQPAFVVAILALLGVASLPTFFTSPDAGSKSAAVESPAAAATTAAASSSADSGEFTPDAPHVRDLKPLLEYLADDDPLPVKDQDLADYLRDHLAPPTSIAWSSHCLIPSKAPRAGGSTNFSTSFNEPSSCKDISSIDRSCPGTRPRGIRARLPAARTKFGFPARRRFSPLSRSTTQTRAKAAPGSWCSNT